MEKVWNLILFIKDIYTFLSGYQLQHKHVTIYKPSFYIKIYNDLFENKFVNYYIEKSLSKAQLILKPINKKIDNKNRYILYDLVKRKSFILSGVEITNFEYITSFEFFVALLEGKNNKLINKIAIKNKLRSMLTICKKLEYNSDKELELLYKQFLDTNKANLDYFKMDNNLLLLNGCKIVDNTYDDSIYLSAIIDIVFGIYIPIDFDSKVYKNYKFKIEEEANLITSFIIDKFLQYKPNDKFKYFNIEYSCLTSFEKNGNHECIITIDFMYNSLLDLLLFIDLLETINYL